MSVTGLIDPFRQRGFPDRPDRFEHEPSINLSNENATMRVGGLRGSLDCINHRVSGQGLEIKVALFGLVSPKSKNKRDEGENKKKVFQRRQNSFKREPGSNPSRKIRTISSKWKKFSNEIKVRASKKSEFIQTNITK